MAPSTSKSRFVSESPANGEPASELLLGTWAPCFRVGPNQVAYQSPYLEHIRMLRDKLAPQIDTVRVLAPSYSPEHFEREKSGLSTIDEAEERIFYHCTHREDDSARTFWTKRVPHIWRVAGTSCANAAMAQTGLDDDALKPMLSLVSARTKLANKPCVFIVDIDFRRDAWMALNNGLFNLRQFVSTLVRCDLFRWSQLLASPWLFDLSLLKSGELVRRYGRGRPNVRNFYDTAHSKGDVVESAELERRLSQRTAAGDRPLRAIYFGRLVDYKGIDRMLEAIQGARALSGRDITLTVVGNGPERDALERLSTRLGTGNAVSFEPAVPYGPRLFEKIASCDVSLAAPLMEDTPRSAFDSMALGLPVVAYDTNYYRDLSEHGGVVLASPQKPAALARRLVELDRDREKLASHARSAVQFARDNTQEIWLERRRRWMLELLPESRATGRSGQATDASLTSPRQ